MKDGDKILESPKCVIKPEYLNIIKEIWNDREIMFDELNDDIIEQYKTKKIKQ